MVDDVSNKLNGTRTAYQLVDRSCGFDAQGSLLTNSLQEHVSWLELGAAFLRHLVGVPPGCTLEIFWSYDPHGPGIFPWIAIGYDERGRDHNNEMLEHAERLMEALEKFNRAVDWKSISRRELLSEAGDT